MIGYFILGIAIVIGCALTLRWFTTADPKILVRVLAWFLFIVVTSVLVLMLFTGRLNWALGAVLGYLPFIWRWLRSVKNNARASSGTLESEDSQVETRFLRMTLDVESGAMDGEILEGAHQGRALSALAPDDLISLLKTCWMEDDASARVLEAYLDRTVEDWRDRVQEPSPPTASGSMTRDEALQVLGLEGDATPDAVKEAHRRLMAGLHPDHGGSTYLAAKINQAKDLLLRA